MDDLISRSALKEWLTRPTGFRANCEDCTDIDCLDCIIGEAIDNEPAVDAETVFEAVGLVKEAFEMAKADLAPVVRCENCTHQQKVWHDDKRMKEGGFFIYSCKLNEDPFVTHVVNGNPGEFCCAGERRTDE